MLHYQDLIFCQTSITLAPKNVRMCIACTYIPYMYVYSSICTATWATPCWPGASLRSLIHLLLMKNMWSRTFLNHWTWPVLDLNLPIGTLCVTCMHKALSCVKFKHIVWDGIGRSSTTIGKFPWNYTMLYIMSGTQSKPYTSSVTVLNSTTINTKNVDKIVKSITQACDSVMTMLHFPALIPI